MRNIHLTFVCRYCRDVEISLSVVAFLEYRNFNLQTNFLKPILAIVTSTEVLRRSPQWALNTHTHTHTNTHTETERKREVN